MRSFNHRIVKRATSNYLKLFFLCTVISAIPNVASARPPKPGGGSCTCDCVAPSGAGGKLIQVLTYNSGGYSCLAFNNATCNMNNPYTGGVATGTLNGCAPAGSSSQATVYVPMFGPPQTLGYSRVVRQPPPVHRAP